MPDLPAQPRRTGVSAEIGRALAGPQRGPADSTARAVGWAHVVAAWAAALGVVAAVVLAVVWVTGLLLP